MNNSMKWQGLPLIIFGSGGISKEVYSLIKYINASSNQRIFNFQGFVGIENSEIGNIIIDNEEIVTSDQSLDSFVSKYPILGMVLPMGTPKAKSIIYNKIKDFQNIVFPNIIHPNVNIDSENTTIGVGNIIGSGAILTCNIKVGNFNLINLNSTVGHDTEIGDFNVINPLVALSGNVELRDSCLIGTGAKVLQGLTINSNSTIGAGAVVVKDVESYTTVVGVPAKTINKK